MKSPKFIGRQLGRAVLICLGTIILSGCTEEKAKVYPQTSALTESVYASVLLKPKNEYQLFAAVSGILEKVYVEEGQLVAKGDTLFQITNSNPQLNAQNAHLAFTQAKDNLSGSASPLKSLSREIESAELRFSNDSLLYFKQKKLWEQGIGSEVDFTNRQAAYDLSKNNLGLAKLRLANTRESLQSQLQQTKNNLSSALNSKKDFTVTSKQAGKIYLINKKEGELVLPQEPIGTMGDASEFVIEMSVDEMDIVKLKPGLLTLITLDAYKNLVFEANVVKVYPQKDLRTQTFRVEADFKTLPEQLYSGLSGEANIVIQQKENVLSIPKSYLVNGNQVNIDSGLATVTLGLQSLDRVEILSGLDAGMAILKPEVVK